MQVPAVCPPAAMLLLKLSMAAVRTDLGRKSLCLLDMHVKNEHLNVHLTPPCSGDIIFYEQVYIRPP